MSSGRNFVLKSRNTLHNNDLQVQINGVTIYLEEINKLNSDDYSIELIDSKKSRLVATAKVSVSGDRYFMSLGELNDTSTWQRIRRVPPHESVDFEVRGIRFAWKCTKNVTGVRNFNLVRLDDDETKLATFSKTRGLLVRRTMGELWISGNLDFDVEVVGRVSILKDQERIRLNASSCSGGGAGGFG